MISICTKSGADISLVTATKTKAKQNFHKADIAVSLYKKRRYHNNRRIYIISGPEI
jgi:hypothetical protein